MDTTGSIGDIWAFHIYSKTRKLQYGDTHLLLEYIETFPSPYPNGLIEYKWKALNLSYGEYEDLIIDYDPSYWKKVG
jgi:hypothetical protein